MGKNNLELFKQALSEGLSNKFDSVANTCACEIACSEKHELAMKTIMYGKTSTKKAWSPRMKKIIAILIAAALLLTSCGIIFRHEIRDIIEYIGDTFVNLTYSGDKSTTPLIEDIYELSYVPEGYVLTNCRSTLLSITYEYSNHEKVLFFEQMTLGSSIFLDNEVGSKKFISDVYGLDIFYKSTPDYNTYHWNDGKYAYQILSSEELTPDVIIKIIAGLSLK